MPLPAGRRRDPGQQLPGPEPAFALLDRPGRRIHRLDHAQPAAHRSLAYSRNRVRYGAQIRSI
jgi:hypothetical protein